MPHHPIVFDQEYVHPSFHSFRFCAASYWLTSHCQATGVPMGLLEVPSKFFPNPRKMILQAEMDAVYALIAQLLSRRSTSPGKRFFVVRTPSGDALRRVVLDLFPDEQRC
jgi:hypothetical protein